MKLRGVGDAGEGDFGAGEGVGAAGQAAQRHRVAAKTGVQCIQGAGERGAASGAGGFFRIVKQFGLHLIQRDEAMQGDGDFFDAGLPPP